MISLKIVTSYCHMKHSDRYKWCFFNFNRCYDIHNLSFFRPVSIRDFRAWVERSSSDSDFRFAEEFDVSILDLGLLTQLFFSKITRYKKRSFIIL